MKKNPKWLTGASDPTGILYPYTTLCDVATIYGAKAGSYDIEPIAGVSGKQSEDHLGKSDFPEKLPDVYEDTGIPGGKSGV